MQMSHDPALTEKRLEEMEHILAHQHAVKGEMVAAGLAVKGVGMEGATMDAFEQALHAMDDHMDHKIKISTHLIEEMRDLKDKHLHTADAGADGIHHATVQLTSLM